MKDQNANRVFATRVAAKVQKANALGTKTTWTQEDHHAAMAQVLAEAEVKPGSDPATVFLALIQDTYNASAFQQMLAKKFAGTGHFVRRDGAKQTTSAFDEMLNTQMVTVATPTVEAKAAE